MLVIRKRAIKCETSSTRGTLMKLVNCAYLYLYRIVLFRMRFCQKIKCIKLNPLISCVPHITSTWFTIKNHKNKKAYKKKTCILIAGQK